MTLGRFLPLGTKLPRGYGVTFRDIDRLGHTIHPIPLNLLVRWAKNLSYWLRGFRPAWAATQITRTYDSGFQAGFKFASDMFDQRAKAVEDRIDQLQRRMGLTK